MLTKNELVLSKSVRTSCWLLVTSFLIFYVILSFCNRPLTDDFFFFNEFSTKGFSATLKDFDFNIRLTGFFIIYLQSLLTQLTGNLNTTIFVFQMFILIFLTASIYIALKTHINVAKGAIKNNDLLLISFLILSSYFFFTFQLNEVWFWNASSCIHLLPIPFFIMGFSFLLRKSFSIKNNIYLIICFLLLGGLSETFVLNSYSFLLVILLYQFKNGRLRLRSQLFIKTVIAFLSLSILFLPNVLSNGVQNKIILGDSRVQNMIFSDFFNAIFLQRKLIIFCVLLLLFYFLGTLYNRSFKNQSRELYKYLFILPLVSFISTFVPLFFIYSNFGPLRAWTPFGFVFGTSLITMSFILGRRRRSNNQLTILFSSVATLLIVIYCFRQFPLAINYRLAYDHRTKVLLKHKNLTLKNSLQLAPLPESGILIKSSLTEDSTHWANYCLREYHKLEFSIYTNRQVKN